MNEKANEVDQMHKVNQHPKAHEDSTPEEEALLRELHGEPDSEGVYGRTPEEEEA